MLMFILILMLLKLMTNGQKYSESFKLPEFQYECPSVQCDIDILKSSYYHTIVGTNVNSTVNLVVFRICEILQYCVKKENIKIILHKKSNDENEDTVNYIAIKNFLEHMNIKFQLWEGIFSADGKMIQSYNMLNKSIKNNSNLLMYQTDIDEIPDPIKFAKALKELQSGSCDAIRGIWFERITNDGSLMDIKLTSSLTDQFPLQCKISDIVVGGGKTKKVIAYRANLRVDGGQHDVWCDRPALKGKQWTMNSSCTEHIFSRGKKKYYSFIMQHLPVIQKSPIYCKTIVPIDHYKFVGGVEKYLNERMQSYSKLGYHWWKDSLRFLKIIKKNNGKICVDCANTHCFNTTSGSYVI